MLNTAVRIKGNKNHLSQKNLANIYGRRNLVQSKLVSQTNSDINSFDILELILVLNNQEIKYNLKPKKNIIYLFKENYELIHRFLKNRPFNIERM